MPTNAQFRFNFTNGVGSDDVRALDDTRVASRGAGDDQKRAQIPISNGEVELYITNSQVQDLKVSADSLFPNDSGSTSNADSSKLFGLMSKHKEAAETCLKKLTEYHASPAELRRMDHPVEIRPFFVNPKLDMRVAVVSMRIDNLSSMSQPMTPLVDGGYMVELPNQGGVLMYGWYIFRVPAKSDTSQRVKDISYTLHYRSIQPLRVPQIRNGGGSGVINNGIEVSFPSMAKVLKGIARGSFTTDLCMYKAQDGPGPQKHLPSNCRLDIRNMIEIGGVSCETLQMYDKLQGIVDSDEYSCWEYSQTIDGFGTGEVSNK